ncbi:hypothetical protein ACM01_25880 [Streptomyces viridochromogenes]|uniref:Uncharacterized protein n=1 Tax=Streptomyces viridochromogenes TaxID=1938 RepID=A0A0J7Z8M0_STRVR|nr:hypothetical protein ACM01_25880 [Streptomyces viridochromogenes]KOG21129.1 hypothetical protein ADK36_15820 [Streptomyces viridochromogenes]KOG22659.1 hypothetical protein ADK35_15045 [Streptomyces viridochromogenes]
MERRGSGGTGTVWRARDTVPPRGRADIPPAPRGGTVLTGFGIAALQGTTALTATGELAGSPEYTPRPPAPAGVGGPRRRTPLVVAAGSPTRALSFCAERPVPPGG